MLFLLLPLLLILAYIGIRNALISKKNQLAYAFSAIDAMLKKRFDLIPNLVETVQQYMSYEQDTLAKVVELRTAASAPDLSRAQKNDLEAELTKGVNHLLLNVENYPALKANTSFEQLQRTWIESEEQIAAARRSYNAAVTTYNTAIMIFPNNLVANQMNLKQEAVLSIPAEERQNIDARSLFNR